MHFAENFMFCREIENLKKYVEILNVLERDYFLERFYWRNFKNFVSLERFFQKIVEIS